MTRAGKATLVVNDDNTVTIHNLFYDHDGDVTGTVDLEAKTITFVDQQVKADYVLINQSDKSTTVVANIKDDGTIELKDVNGQGPNGWFGPQMTDTKGGFDVTLTKVLWTAEATWTLPNEDEDKDPYTGTSTLFCYDGAVGYTYSMVVGLPAGLVPACELKLAVNEDGSLKLVGAPEGNAFEYANLPMITSGRYDKLVFAESGKSGVVASQKAGRLFFDADYYEDAEFDDHYTAKFVVEWGKFVEATMENITGTFHRFEYHPNKFDMSRVQKATITDNGDNTVTIHNLFHDHDGDVTGTVDLQARTITFVDQEVKPDYVLVNQSDKSATVVATIEPDGTILFKDVNGKGPNGWFGPQMTDTKGGFDVTLTKVLWTAEATWTLPNEDEDKDPYTGTNTLFCHDGAEGYTYSMVVGLPAGMVPACELKFAVNEDGSLELVDAPEGNAFEYANLPMITSGRYDKMEVLTDDSKVEGTETAGSMYFYVNYFEDAEYDDNYKAKFTIEWGEKEPTAIEAIVPAEKAYDENAPLYNIAGQRVAKGTKGLLIQGGRKIFVK